MLKRVGRFRALLFAGAVLATVGLAACAPEPTPTPTPTPVWLSAGPRGVQFTSDFQLVELFRNDDPLTRYQGLTMGAQGREIYAIGYFGKEEAEDIDPQETAVVRMYGLQEEQVQTEVVLKFSDLKDPALWDPDIDLPGLIFPGGLSVASNGDLFLVAEVWTGVEELPRYAFRPSGPPTGTSLIVRRPNGTLQKVLTVRELVDAGVLDAAAADQTPRVAVAPAAPDHLWLQFITFEPVDPSLARSQMIVRRFLYQVQDPNGDGDWSDRKVAPLALPPFVAEQQRSDCCSFMGLVAEPFPGGMDRSPSILLLMSTPFPDVEHRVYRVSDHNGDGDALDAGEFELLFAGISPSGGGPGSIVASRIVLRDGKVEQRELVISSFTTSTRVSRISETGEVIDIARAFSSISDVLADSQGNVYVWAWPPDGFGARVLYKLNPAPEGMIRDPGVVTVATQPFPTPQPAAGTITPGVPRIAFTREVFLPRETGEILLIGADGSGPIKLIGGEYNFGFCQSADGSHMGYWSSEEVPNEAFVYVANADGSNPRKVTEERVTFWCLFSADSLPLTVRKGRSTTLIRHDLKSGEETTVLTGADRLVKSPDGRSFLFVSGLDFTKFPPAGAESLEVVDIDTGERHRLDGPLTEGSYSGLQWSSDGWRVAYLVSSVPPPFTREEREEATKEGEETPEELMELEHRGVSIPLPGRDYNLYVTDVLSGETKLVYQVEGTLEPAFHWSPSGDWLLVSVIGEQRQSLLVNVRSGEARQVASGEEVPTVFHWAPNEDSFAYAISEVLYLESVNGDIREVPLSTTFEEACPFCESFGWSPDGRYIGLTDWWQTIAVLDTTSGEIRTLIQEEGENQFLSPKWWR